MAFLSTMFICFILLRKKHNLFAWGLILFLVSFVMLEEFRFFFAIPCCIISGDAFLRGVEYDGQKNYGQQQNEQYKIGYKTSTNDTTQSQYGMIINGRSISLSIGKILYTGHADKNNKKAIAKVIVNPNDGKTLGIKNLSNKTWDAIIPTTGEHRAVQPGKGIKLGKGLIIDFGGITCKIV